MISSINTIEDVITFTRQLISEGVNFHPDDDFSNYVNIVTDQPTYSLLDSNHRNDLLRQSINICNRENIDIYDLTQEVFLKETGLDKFIPLPPKI